MSGAICDLTHTAVCSIVLECVLRRFLCFLQRGPWPGAAAHLRAADAGGVFAPPGTGVVGFTLDASGVDVEEMRPAGAAAGAGAAAARVAGSLSAADVDAKVGRLRRTGR